MWDYKWFKYCDNVIEFLNREHILPENSKIVKINDMIVVFYYKTV